MPSPGNTPPSDDVAASPGDLNELSLQAIDRLLSPGGASGPSDNDDSDTESSDLDDMDALVVPDLPTLLGSLVREVHQDAQTHRWSEPVRDALCSIVRYTVIALAVHRGELTLPELYHCVGIMEDFSEEDFTDLEIALGDRLVRSRADPRKKMASDSLVLRRIEAIRGFLHAPIVNTAFHLGWLAFNAETLSWPLNLAISSAPECVSDLSALIATDEQGHIVHPLIREILAIDGVLPGPMLVEAYLLLDRRLSDEFSIDAMAMYLALTLRHWERVDGLTDGAIDTILRQYMLSLPPNAQTLRTLIAPHTSGCRRLQDLAVEYGYFEAHPELLKHQPAWNPTVERAVANAHTPRFLSRRETSIARTTPRVLQRYPIFQENSVQCLNLAIFRADSQAAMILLNAGAHPQAIEPRPTEDTGAANVNRRQVRLQPIAYLMQRYELISEASDWRNKDRVLNDLGKLFVAMVKKSGPVLFESLAEVPILYRVLRYGNQAMVDALFTRVQIVTPNTLFAVDYAMQFLPKYDTRRQLRLIETLPSQCINGFIGTTLAMAPRDWEDLEPFTLQNAALERDEDELRHEIREYPHPLFSVCATRKPEVLQAYINRKPALERAVDWEGEYGAVELAMRQVFGMHPFAKPWTALQGRRQDIKACLKLLTKQYGLEEPWINISLALLKAADDQRLAIALDLLTDDDVKNVLREVLSEIDTKIRKVVRRDNHRLIIRFVDDNHGIARPDTLARVRRMGSEYCLLTLAVELRRLISVKVDASEAWAQSPRTTVNTRLFGVGTVSRTPRFTPLADAKNSPAKTSPQHSGSKRPASGEESDGSPERSPNSKKQRT